MYPLPQKLELAVAAVVKAAVGESVKVATSTEYETLVPPYVTVIASDGDDVMNTGVFNIPITVEVAGASDPKSTENLEAHRELAGTVFNALHDDELATSLSQAVSDLTVYGVFQRRYLATRAMDRTWFSGEAFTCAVVNQTLTA